MERRVWTSTELPFVGRTELIKTYQDRLLQIRTFNGQILAIIGAPGIGKTRLIRECLKLTPRESIFTFFIATTPKLSLNDCFEQILSQFLNRPMLSNIIPMIIDEEVYNPYAHRFPILKSAFPYEPMEKTKGSISKEIVSSFFDKLSHLSPIALFLDDFHESGFEIKEFTTLLIKQLHNLPIIIVIASRPVDGVLKYLESLKSSSPLLKIELEPLKSDEVKQFNQLLFAGDLPNHIFTWIHQKTNGHPLFTREFLFYLFRKGIIYLDTTNNQWRATELFREIKIPETLNRIVEEQLANLSPSAQKFLKRSSFLTMEEFELRAVNFKIIKNDLDEILRHYLLIKQNEQYHFLHPLIKEIIYNLIPEKDRMKEHNLLGEYLLKNQYIEEAVNQFIISQRHDKKFLNLLITLIKQLKNRNENYKALLYEEHLLKLLSSFPNLITLRTLAILVDSASSLRRYNRFSEAIKYYNIALKFLTKYKRKRAKEIIPFVYMCRTYAELRLGDYQGVIRSADRVKRCYKLFKMKPENKVIVPSETNRAFAYAQLGLHKKALKLAFKLKNNFYNTDDLNQKFRINYCIAMTYFRIMDWQNTVVWAKRALTIAKKIGDVRYIAAMNGNLGIAYMFLGKFNDAMNHLLTHQTLSKKNHWTREEFMAHLNFGNFYFFQGYLGRADDEFNKALQIIERLNFKPDLAAIYYCYAYFLMFKGDYITSKNYLKKAMEINSQLGDGGISKLNLLCHGYLQVLQKDFSELKKTLDFLREKYSEELDNEADFILLKGFLSLKDHNQIEDIENSLKILIRQKNYVKLVQLLIICKNALSQFEMWHKKAMEFKDQALEYAQKYSMPGWVDYLSPASIKREVLPLEIYTLGRLTIKLPDKRIIEEHKWEWAKPKQLFTILLNAHLKKQSLSRDQIGAMLWPELPQDKLVNNFHVALNQLKSVIGKEYIQFSEKTYSLTDVAIDAEKFLGLIGEAKKLLNDNKIHGAEYQLNKIIELYKGKYLEDFYDDWVLEMRDFLYEQYREAVLMLAEIYLKKLNTQAAIGLITRLIISDPLDEEAHRFLMSAYIQAGKKEKAIEQYKKCAQIFKKELGCEPSETTINLYHSIIKN